MSGERESKARPLVVAAEDAARAELEGQGPLRYLEALDEPTGKLEMLRFGSDPRIEGAVTQILEAIGEEPEREGLLRTPSRVAKAYAELTAGYRVDPVALINDAIFTVHYDEMVVVRDIHFYSLCIPSKQIVNAVGGAKAARNVRVGDRLWTLHEGKVVPTTVTEITSRKARELVEIETEQGKVQTTPDHPFATPEGWLEAKDLAGKQVEWTEPRSLCRRRYPPSDGYEFGYAIGATCADGTVAGRYVSLVVNSEEFASKYAASLRVAFGADPNIEPVTRPSGFTGRQTPGYRVRVVSSYLADLFRQYAGGDAHHMRQQFPRVVLNSEPTFQGFLDGYVDGDGFRNTNAKGRTVVSSNVAFLGDMAQTVGARFSPQSPPMASRLFIADSWQHRHGFQKEAHRTDLAESRWVNVHGITHLPAGWRKPYTVYSFKCEPYPTFLVGGHLTHNCEHHMLPFYGHAHVAYIPNGKVIGLSKIPRIVEMYARRLQVQERMTVEIADFLDQHLQPAGVAVVAEGVHMCSVMRGVRKENASMVTSAMRGTFKTDSDSRSELFELIHSSRHHD